FAVPAAGERAVVMGLNIVDGIQHHHARKRRHFVVCLTPTGRIPSEYAERYIFHEPYLYISYESSRKLLDLMGFLTPYFGSSNNLASSGGISGTARVVIFTASPSLAAIRFFLAHSGSGFG